MQVSSIDHLPVIAVIHVMPIVVGVLSVIVGVLRIVVVLYASSLVPTCRHWFLHIVVGVLNVVSTGNADVGLLRPGPLLAVVAFELLSSGSTLP